MIFIDTNIFLYAAGLDGEDDPRTQKARDLLAQPLDFATSVQVFGEFVDSATRRSRPIFLTNEQAFRFVDQWRAIPIQATSLEVFDSAVLILSRSNFRYWDCAIIAAALALGCDTLYSEDMQHGREIDGLRIVNPFLEA